jgi:hypothetical protein
MACMYLYKSVGRDREGGGEEEHEAALCRWACTVLFGSCWGEGQLHTHLC